MERIKRLDERSKTTEELSAFKNSVAFFPGRFAPAHKGHIRIIEKLANEFEKVVIGIGSCYESGTERHPLCAVFREKIILSSIRNQGIDENKIGIVHMQDFPTFEEWFEHTLNVARIKKVTHFVTGNEKDILGELKVKKIELPFELINPETDSDFDYHATDLRNAIVQGDYETFKKIASFGTLQLMSNIGGFNGIRSSIENKGTQFIPGRQAVDVVFTVNHKTVAHNGRKTEEIYFLGGRRLVSKKNFPGYLAIPGGGIVDYDSPINTALRELKEETGIEVTMLDNTVEPAHVLIKADNKNIIGEMRFLKLFSTNDPKISGEDGGSSQVFHINLDENPEIFKNSLRANSDLEEVGFYPILKAKEEKLAFQQSEMLKLALSSFKLV